MLHCNVTLNLCLTGELNKEFLERDNREQYFKLCRQMGITTYLTKFSANSDTVDSIVLGMTCVYNTLKKICDTTSAW